MSTDYLVVDRLSLSYGKGGFALSDATFSARKGEIIALLGPSGCGKTTLLNLIAGFLTPDGGSIRVDGRDLANVPTHRRDMGMVFQNYALFPHLSVEKNVAYGLEARKVPGGEARQRVAEALDLVGLAHAAARYPRQLSGGQQQRIALARAMVIRPSIFLLDEPLSNLDTLLRKSMRQEIHDILKRAGITAVLVTHDQEEALVVADRILLMSEGRIDQAGSPRQIYEKPASVFGARFMESENLIEGTVEAIDEKGVVVHTSIGRIAAAGSDEALSLGDRVTLTIRPERIRVVEDDGSQPDSADGNGLRVTVQSASYVGTYERLTLSANGFALVAHAPVGAHMRCRDEPVRVSWRRSDTHVLLR